MSKDIELKKKLPNDEIATFCNQVAMILESGIPLYDGIDTLAEATVDDDAKAIFNEIARTVEETGSLYEGVRKVSIFPDYMISMIRIGEETGKLDDVLNSLSAYYERDYHIGRTIKSAISYPMVLIVMMTAVITLLVAKVLPIFREIFENIGGDTTKKAQSIMDTATVIGYVIFVVTLVFLICAGVIYILIKCGHGDKVKNVAYKLPGLRKISRKISAARFASVIGMMLESGYSIEKSLELAPNVAENKEIKDKILECQKMVNEDGKEFTDALAEIGMFDVLSCRMINVGFKAGRLDEVLAKLSKQYEMEIDESLDKVVSIIEPTLVALMSLIIGGILISVMLPLTNIMSAIG